MDDETEKLVRDVFQAYALPWGVYEEETDGPGKGGVFAKAVVSGKAHAATNVEDAMDEIGWRVTLALFAICLIVKKIRRYSYEKEVQSTIRWKRYASFWRYRYDDAITSCT